ncbi:HlyD family secretion protein [Dyella sp. C11]|uniref:HlyD family secretion protein n=1 Tax=Dyella sp. C11 TaxID=2126991 RepID=UPI000D6431AE|nr:HlyD family secretion protein [Dyella sp. C11]
MPQDPRDSSAPDATPAQASKARRTRLVLMTVAGVAVLVAAWWGIGWWLHGRFVQTTNDAYLKADQVAAAPKVQGYVAEVLVGDNQDVVAGQPLVRIDASNYQSSLDQQNAALDARKADLRTAERQITQQESSIAQAKAQWEGSRANAAYAAREAERFKNLSSQGVETAEKAADARNQQEQATSKEQASAAALQQAERQLDTLKAQADQARAQLEAAQAQLATAHINLDDTLIRARIAGRIGDRAVQVGQYVQPGTRLMTVVPVDHVYLVANFKETQVAHMRAGQPAKIKVDALDGRVVDGVVDSFSPGTGAQFALLPAQNATGNFTKIVQRVPVRIRVTVPDDLKGRLLPGYSVTVDVDTQAGQAHQS